MAQAAWQRPFVNVFKHVQISDWKKASKEGDVVAVMDRAIKSTVYRVCGAVPASNYIQLPMSTSQSLGLTGQYFYLLFKPIANKCFVIHLDVATNDGLVIRVSVSNLFKEFKSTSTWLQFPFICSATKGSIGDKTSQSTKDLVGPAPATPRWTILCLDLQLLLSSYVGKAFSHVKGVRLCANLLVKNICTSQYQYTPGVKFDDLRKMGQSVVTSAPLPRELAYPLGKGQVWEDLYDYIMFPSEGVKKPHDSMQTTELENRPVSATVHRVAPRPMFNAASSSCTEVVTVRTDVKKPQPVTSDLPRVNVTEDGQVSDVGQSGGGVDVHVYAGDGDVVEPPVTVARREGGLLPDPIIELHKCLGFGGSAPKDVVFQGTCVFFPCHSLVVSMDTKSGHQKFFIGHSDKVSCLALATSHNLLASGQSGNHALIRLWNSQTSLCYITLRSHAMSLSAITMGPNGQVMAALGKDQHRRNLLVVYNISTVATNKMVALMAKAVTDVNIISISVNPLDMSRFATCGHDNVRLWRIKDGRLRSAAVALGELHRSVQLTDLDFVKSSAMTEQKLLVCSTLGHIFEVNVPSVAVERVRCLLPTEKENSTVGLNLTCLNVSDSCCITGSTDGYVRIWTADFQQVLMEADLSSPVVCAAINSDSSLVACCTQTTLGVLDTMGRTYSTLVRGHCGTIVAMDLKDDQLITAARDKTMKIWAVESLAQLFDFSAVTQTPLCVVFHPSRSEFACAFDSGHIRVFDIGSTSLIKEIKVHEASVYRLLYSPDGCRLYSLDFMGTLCLYESYHPARVLPEVSAAGPEACMSVSRDGRTLAVIGRSKLVVTVMDGCTLDEMLRIDVSCIGSDSRDVVAEAQLVHHIPGHLLVATTTQRLLKLNDRTGKLVGQLDNCWKHRCRSLALSPTGKFLAIADDRFVRIVDGQLRNIGAQMFVGHSEPIERILFTNDETRLLSCGDSLIMWDFLGSAGRVNIDNQDREEMPRSFIPTPRRMEEEKLAKDLIENDFEEDESELLDSDYLQPMAAKEIQALVHLDKAPPPVISKSRDSARSKGRLLTEEMKEPKAKRHFRARNQEFKLSKDRYTAPSDQAGLSLSAIIGYNGNARDNLIWQPDTGLYIYTSGSIVIIEDLETGAQRHLKDIHEEVSTLTLQPDCSSLAVAYAGGTVVVWKLETATKQFKLREHRNSVVAMKYSNDEKFLVTVGGYRDGLLILWNTEDYTINTKVLQEAPMHCVAWRPDSCNELVTAGVGGVTFWSLQENSTPSLTPHTVPLPRELSSQECTSLDFSDDGMMYVGTSAGHVTTWDCRSQQCCWHWSADRSEIGQICIGQSVIVTAGSSLRLWSVSQDIKVTMEDEMTLGEKSAYLTASVFDKQMELGIVGSDHGSIWYVNWPQRSSVRLVAGHHGKINSLAVHASELLATGDSLGHVSVWGLSDREQTLQFNVRGCSCECVAFAEASNLMLLAGFGDGTVRVFDMVAMELQMKIKPHNSSVASVVVSGNMIISGCSSGLVALTSATTGITVRIIDDHQGAPITNLMCAPLQEDTPFLWLACSNDRRVSVWSADWSRDFCDLVDWLTFPGPAADEKTASVPSLACFSPEEPDIVMFTGLDFQKQIHFYSLTDKKVLRTLSLNQWARTLHVAPDMSLIAVGCNEHLLKLMDYYEGTFQDFTGHDSPVTNCYFTQNEKQLLSTTDNQIFIWNIRVHGN